MDKEIIQYVKDDFLENQGETLLEIMDNMVLYTSAIKEISTKLEILNEEFQFKNKRNPIEHIKSRVKKPNSILEKLRRKGMPINYASVRDELMDVAGIRVVCSFIDDIYLIASLLKSQDDISLITEKDYIKNPKANGYRSLHLVLEIPIFFSDRTERVKAEIQIRTIAMDFWASLEHKLYYKVPGDIPESIRADLKRCADVIAATDLEMQEIHKRVDALL